MIRWKQALVIAASVASFFIVREISKPIGAYVRQEFFTPTTSELVASAAQSLNAQLPATIDDITTLVSVTSDAETLIYNYEIAADLSNVDMPGYRNEIQRHLLTNVCTSPEMLNDMKIGVMFKYVYRSTDLTPILEFKIDSDVCKAQTETL